MHAYNKKIKIPLFYSKFTSNPPLWIQWGFSFGKDRNISIYWNLEAFLRAIWIYFFFSFEMNFVQLRIKMKWKTCHTGVLKKSLLRVVFAGG